MADTEEAKTPRQRKVAVVTGAARGIGRSCSQTLAKAGFDVVLVDLLKVQAEETAAEIKALGVDAMVIEADVTEFQRAEEAAVEIVDRFGRIDVLVNNAGRTMPKGLLDITEAEWDSTIEVNLKSCFCWSRAVAPIMLKQQHGRMINIASLNALTGGVTSAVSKFAYASAKAGVLGMTKSLAKELGPHISVNAICPGIIKTDLTADLLETRKDELTRGISLERFGTPEDIAELVCFLASSQHCFLNGQHIVVDGGQWIA